MPEDRSTTKKLYCENCKRRSPYFELFAPEGELVLMKCLNCGALIYGDKQPHGSWLGGSSGLKMVGVAAILALFFFAYSLSSNNHQGSGIRGVKSPG
jgi:hypothetical protein